MKILSIRGRNLASLAGDWEVRFDSGPLAKAGTFAITGPTGAGKSTLFDALCLALFARTPRYQGSRDGQGYAVGSGDQDDKDKLKAGDPRSILRRGTSEGFAEAEFLDKDGNRFRAKWTIKRANGSSTGRMQAAVHALVNLATGHAELGRDAVDKQVEKLLGFTQEQFVRAVLLPQGEFAAFLKAKADQRANVLEALTDSAIFGKIGAKSFEMATNARTAWESEQLQRQAIPVLSPEERAATVARRTELAELAKGEKALIETARSAVQWFGRQAALAAAVEAARTQLAAPLASNEAAKSRREQLQAIDGAAPFRESVGSAKTAETLAKAAENLAANEKVGLDTALDALQLQVPAAALAEELATAAKKARADLEPTLQKARRLDEQTVELRKTLATQKATSDRLDAAFATAHSRSQQAQASLGEARKLATNATDWLANHVHLAALVADWTLYESRLNTFAKAQSNAKNVADELPKLHERLTEQTGIVREALTFESTCKLNFATTRTTREQAESFARTFDEADLQARRKSLTAAQVQLTQLAELVKKATFLASECTRTQAEASTAAAAQADFLTESAAAESMAKTHAICLKEARDAHDRAKQTADFSEHRRELKPGEPCALCGATEHPYADSDPLAERLLVGQIARIAELEGLFGQSNAAAISGTEKARAAGAAFTRAIGESQRFSAELDTSVKEWRATGLAGEPDSAALAPRLAELEAGQSALQATEADALIARKSLERASVGERDAQTALEHATGARSTAETELETRRTRLGEAEQSLQRYNDQRDEAERELATAFSGWPMWEARLHTDPRGFSGGCADEVSEYRRQSQVAAQLSIKITKEEAELQGLVGLADAAKLQFESATAELGGTTDILAKVKAERTQLLDGEDASAVEKRLADAVTSAEGALETATVELRRLETEVATRTGQSTSAAAAARKSRQHAAQLVAERDTALGAAGRSLAEIEALLAFEPAVVESERRSLAALADAAKTAQQTLAAREGDLAEHEGTQPPDSTATEAAAALENAESTAMATTRELGATDAKLKADDEAQLRRVAFDAELDRLKSIKERWETLCNVIGDRQGKRFRLFAQSITLDLLVARANRHLSQLAPRYRLQRVPNVELELQVIDRDNGDDIRSLASLSGGETFLASLALALGLSSIASKNLHIGSLFIDEGFGTLDAATLLQAVEVLNGLHATGRQVGIISHVEGLADQLGGWISVRKVSSTRSEIKVGTGVFSMTAQH